MFIEIVAKKCNQQGTVNNPPQEVRFKINGDLVSAVQPAGRVTLATGKTVLLHDGYATDFMLYSPDQTGQVSKAYLAL